MDLKFKILQGYEHERDIPINADELERAYGLFMLGGRWIFSGGPVDGKNIQTVVPDYQRIMGWNEEHKLGPDDYNELAEKGVDRKAQQMLNAAQEKVRYLISSKQENLIGTNTKIPELNRPSTEKRTEGFQRITPPTN